MLGRNLPFESQELRNEGSVPFAVFTYPINPKDREEWELSSS